MNTEPRDLTIGAVLDRAEQLDLGIVYTLYDGSTRLGFKKTPLVDVLNHLLVIVVENTEALEDQE